MRKLYAIAGIVAALLVIVFVSIGSYSEISDYDIVSGIAIDREQGRWLITCEICVPSSDNDFGSKCTYVEGRGDTINEAFEQAGRSSASVLYTGCNQLYLISPSADGDEELVDYFMQDDTNLRAVTVLSQGRACDTLMSNKDSDNARAKSLSIARKISRFCSEQNMPSPKVTEYLKHGAAVTVSETETPVKAVGE